MVGTKSQAENISFASKLSNNVTAMMAISAQAGNTDVGVDTLAVQKWNNELTDRHLVNKFIGTETKEDKEKAEERTIPFVKEQDLFRLLRFVDTVNITGPEGIYRLKDEIEQADSLSVIHRNVMHGLLSYYTKKEKTNPAGLIPFELSLTLRGISGIKVGQAFKIQDSLIPSRYRGNVGFICTGVSHKIENNRWLTDLKTQMCIISSDNLELREKDIDIPSKEEVRAGLNEPEAGETGLLFYSIFNRVRMKTRLFDPGGEGIYSSTRKYTNEQGQEIRYFHQAWDVVRAYENGLELPLENEDIFMPFDGRVRWFDTASKYQKNGRGEIGGIEITGTGEYQGITAKLIYLKEPTTEVIGGGPINRGTRIAKAGSSAFAYGKQNVNINEKDTFQKDHIHIQMTSNSRKIDPRKEEWFPKPAPEIREPELVNLDPFSNLPG